MPRSTSKRLASAPPSLCWISVADRLYKAAVRGGQYVLVSDGAGLWSAHWRPASGRQDGLAFRTTEQLARTACEHHHLEQHTNALLGSTGRKADAALVRADTRGEPAAWKRGFRR